MPMLKKKDMIARIAQLSGKSKSDVEDVLDNLSLVVAEALHSGNEVIVTDIVKLWTELRPAREGRNPHTGEPLHIPEKIIVKAKICKKMKDYADN